MHGSWVVHGPLYSYWVGTVDENLSSVRSPSPTFYSDPPIRVSCFTIHDIISIHVSRDPVLLFCSRRRVRSTSSEVSNRHRPSPLLPSPPHCKFVPVSKRSVFLFPIHFPRRIPFQCWLRSLSPYLNSLWRLHPVHPNPLTDLYSRLLLSVWFQLMF